MNKELEQILNFVDVLVKGSLLNSNDKERLEQWRKDREILYSELERKDKLENFVNVCKKYEMYGTGDAVLIDLSTMSMVLSVPEEDRKILKEFFGEKK